MSDPVTPGAPAPAIAQVPPAAPAAAPLPPAPGERPDPEWLNPRLEQAARAERAKVLAELGVTDPTAAKRALDEARTAAEANKSETEKVATRIKQLEAEAESGRAATATVRTYADAELAKLTDAQRTAVKAVAGEDANRSLSAIAALRPTWATVAAAPAAALAPPATPPASTAPGPAPAPGDISPPDHKAEHSRLKAVNPIAAAAYMNEHADKIYPRA